MKQSRWCSFISIFITLYEFYHIINIRKGRHCLDFASEFFGSLVPLESTSRQYITWGKKLNTRTKAIWTMLQAYGLFVCCSIGQYFLHFFSSIAVKLPHFQCNSLLSAFAKHARRWFMLLLRDRAGHLTHLTISLIQINRCTTFQLVFRSLRNPTNKKYR